ncbi:Uncharacterized conserved protein, DUF2249 family [Paracoccus halophilus]|uniref:Uncharacterized conserved protein, DUF2249 family n=1 Tax=Paracoccus halophilus TaxID=376733 RepID=A0A099F293_9RHOB|nr:DUF2249 domain-containing protein [Paracoccus halophilus]KGJ04366.1 hypothetical protein IT41_10725 [Paracoccus halophilus]SFA55080.1 Uncharacterized conserved protein, DUF2249 family [Paracoccus halophilus]
MQKIVTLDVRPLLAAGEEPILAIIKAADGLAEGQTLRLLAPFRPVPLFSVMQRRGYIHEETEQGDNIWQVDFIRAQAAYQLSPGSALEAVDWPDPTVFLDLTRPEPAEPAARILAAIRAAKPGHVIFALLPAEPAILLPELDARGHKWAGNYASDGTGYRLLVLRGDKP